MSTSTYLAIADRIVNRIGTVTDAGLAFNRLRMPGSQQDIETMFTTDIGGQKRVRAWVVGLAELQDRNEDQSSLRWVRTMLIEGYVQVEDANSSYLTAVSLMESIIRVLSADLRTKLNGTILTRFGPITAKADEFRKLAGEVGVHYLRIQVPVLCNEL